MCRARKRPIKSLVISTRKWGEKAPLEAPPRGAARLARRRSARNPPRRRARRPKRAGRAKRRAGVLSPERPSRKIFLATNAEGKARPPEGFRHARARGCILNTACHTFKAHEGGTRVVKANGDAGESAFALSRLFFFPRIWPPQLAAPSECAPCAPYRAACSCERARMYVRMYPVSARGAKREARGVGRERTAAATAG